MQHFESTELEGFKCLLFENLTRGLTKTTIPCHSLYRNVPLCLYNLHINNRNIWDPSSLICAETLVKSPGFRKLKPSARLHQPRKTQPKHHAPGKYTTIRKYTTIGKDRWLATPMAPKPSLHLLGVCGLRDLHLLSLWCKHDYLQWWCLCEPRKKTSYFLLYWLFIMVYDNPHKTV